MNDLRILSHGQITDLSKGFKMKNGETFSIMVVAKNASSVVTTALCTCRCVCDTEASPFPCERGRLDTSKDSGNLSKRNKPVGLRCLLGSR